MEEAQIMEKIWQLYRRYRFTKMWSRLTWSLFFGVVTSALLILASRITGLFQAGVYVISLPVAAGIAGGLIYHSLNKSELMEVALKSDQRLTLKERLSTALEWIRDRKVRSPMFRGLLRDTAHAARDISPVKVFPLSWKNPSRRIAGAAAAMLLFINLPQLSLLTPRVSPREKTAVKQAAAKVRHAVKKLKKKKIETPEAAKKIEKAKKELEKLARELEKPGVDKRQALMKISKSQEQLKNIAGDKEMMEQIREAMRRSDASSRQKEENEKKQKLLAQLSKTLNQVSRQAEKKNLTEKEKKEIERKLKKARQMMKRAGMKTHKINKAINAAKQGDMKTAAREAKQMAQQFQQRQNQLKGQQQLSEAMQQTMEDLEESKNIMSGNQAMKNFKGQRVKYSKDGKMPADFGRGSTNKAGNKPKEDPGNIYGKREGKSRSHKKEIFQKLYDPKRDEFKTATTKVKGKLSEGPIIRSIRTRVRGAPRIGDKAKVDPVETYVDARAKGEESIKSDNIPSQYRNLIRNYYDDIDPRK